jgi:hypothetical protein
MNDKVYFSEGTEHDEPALVKQAPPETPEPLEGSSKQPQTPQDKTKREFGQGLFISLLGNGFVLLIFLCKLMGLFDGGGTNQSLWGIGVVWFLINFLIMVYLYLKSRYVFQGMVAGYAIGLLMAIIGGVFWGAICFSISGSL